MELTGNMARMKRHLLPAILVAAFAVTALLPAQAGAAVPCRNLIYNDWYKDGKIASTYPIGCYRDALHNLRADARIYSSLSTDIRSAMQAALSRRQGATHVPSQVGKGTAAVGQGAVKHAVITLHPGKTRTIEPKSPGALPGPDRVASSQVASTSDGSSIPTPIIVLGALALLLAATGAIGAGIRRRRRR